MFNQLARVSGVMRNTMRSRAYMNTISVRAMSMDGKSVEESIDEVAAVEVKQVKQVKQVKKEEVGTYINAQGKKCVYDDDEPEPIFHSTSVDGWTPANGCVFNTKYYYSSLLDPQANAWVDMPYDKRFAESHFTKLKSYNQAKKIQSNFLDLGSVKNMLNSSKYKENKENKGGQTVTPAPKGMEGNQDPPDTKEHGNNWREPRSIPIDGGVLNPKLPKYAPETDNSYNKPKETVGGSNDSGEKIQKENEEVSEDIESDEPFWRRRGIVIPDAI